MKRIMGVVLAAAMVLSMTACGNSGSSTATQAPSTAAPTKAPEASAAPAGDGKEAETEAPSGYEPTKSLTLYTSASTSEYELIVGLFKEKYPDIEVDIVSAGTGELSSKISAEAANPQGDVLMGGGASTYTKIADCLEPYRSVNADSLVEEFVPDDSLYTPCYLNVNAFILNNELMKDIPVIVDSWASFLDPALKGQIAFADPSAAGSALEEVINMLTAMSPDGKVENGWEFVEQFIANLDGKIAAGSSDVYKSVVAGEYAVGMTNEDKVINYIQQGADISVAYPKEGITLRTSNIAMIKGGANGYNAQLFIDFVTSKECQTAMESDICVRPARTDVPMTTEGRLSTAELTSLPYPAVDSGEVKTKFQDLVTK